MKYAFLCLCAAVAAMGSVQAALASETEISSSGSASISMPPDIATVRATLETNEATASEATSQNNALYDRVILALERLGIGRQDISLDRYNVRYQSPSAPANSYERAGYTVERAFSITVRKIGDAGAVTDACLSAGATGINGISFGLSDEDAVRARATAMAVADARTTAERLARAGRLHIVGIKAMQVGAFPGVASGMVTIGHVTSSAGGLPTKLDQSNVNVTVDVGVVFLAKP